MKNVSQNLMKQTLSIIIFIILSTNIYAQKDSLLYEFGKELMVYKSIDEQTFTIKKGNRIIWEKLKFIYPTYGSYLQVLDKKNSYFYINSKGKKVKKVNISLELCGTVPHYSYEIIETDEKYILTEDETFYDYENLEPPVAIDSINKSNIKKIHFHNNEQKISFTENTFIFNATKVFPQAIILEKENRKGILYQGDLTFFDEVLYDNGIFKVKQNGLFGYYKITQPKYKELNGFSFGLAKFKLENGKSGYIDKDGKEYYD